MKIQRSKFLMILSYLGGFMNSLVRVLWMRRDTLWESGLMWNRMTQCTLLHDLRRESLSGSALGALGGWNTQWDMCLNVKKPCGRVFASFLFFKCLCINHKIQMHLKFVIDMFIAPSNLYVNQKHEVTA